MKNEPDWAHLSLDYNLTERILYAGEKNPRTRVIAWLLGMVRYYGISKKDGSVELEVPMTQEIMAGFVHLSRERTNKIIRELKNRNLVIMKSHYITVPNIENLQGALYE